MYVLYIVHHSADRALSLLFQLSRANVGSINDKIGGYLSFYNSTYSLVQGFRNLQHSTYNCSQEVHAERPSTRPSWPLHITREQDFALVSSLSPELCSKSQLGWKTGFRPRCRVTFLTKLPSSTPSASVALQTKLAELRGHDLFDSLPRCCFEE